MPKTKRRNINYNRPNTTRTARSTHIFKSYQFDTDVQKQAIKDFIYKNTIEINKIKSRCNNAIKIENKETKTEYENKMMYFSLLRELQHSKTFNFQTYFNLSYHFYFEDQIEMS